MLFWIIVVSLGLEGAIADVVLNVWGKTLSLRSWVLSAFLFLVFMTGFGFAMRLGAVRGYSLTIAVVIVLLADIAGVAMWEVVVRGTHFTSLQWLGAFFATGAMICFELGKK